ncbi:G-type lectin S-receptor-like serine/threonine-protein kinase SD2-5 [Chenopodium quinoa]|uniref:G-type lectin S-receptor-like serine/threonine-protein kinase SD2-5 n=1 Tax=Chenopodium quinoa TaxID=63459 RepID=UPI000B77731C|nr:G-type lectin S-receptor-like serine/threonine-protein kinase SD2-5 [Chenopodium quinoa]
MKLFYTLCYIILVFFMLIILGCCKSNNVSVGYTFTLAIPSDYSEDFNGRAYLMETDQMPLNFRTAVSVEAMDGRYVCSLQVFLGSVMVWSSGHISKFYTSDSCVLEFTKMGDLRLKGLNDDVGWLTGTSGQGVQKLQLLDSGNLVLVDAQENIKWQTFNFPTNILLLGQRLSVATHLTSFPTNKSSSSFFSFEIHHDKVALYLNSGSNNNSNSYKYSYWEFQPSESRNITYIELASRGLEFFDDKFRNFSQIFAPYQDAARFLALDNDTGNLGLYYYSPYKDKLEASFQVLNTTCDLPLACSAYGICTFSRTCSCIRMLARKQDSSIDECNEEFITGNQCGKDEVWIMLELKDADSLLKNATSMSNSSKTRCANSCLNECTCAAALYSSRTRECMFLDVVRGVRQVNRGSGLSYMVKVPKGRFGKHKKSGLKKWVLVLILVGDGMVLFLVLGGLGYFLVWKRKKRLRDGNCSS